MSSNSLFQTGSFRQAAHYIHSHRGKTFVVYINSRVLLAESSLTALIRDLAMMHALGAKLVLVLGAGVFIAQRTTAPNENRPAQQPALHKPPHY